MSEPHKIPAKNQSREAGVTLNYCITPRLDFDGTGPKPDDVFVLFLTARDPARAGRVQEVAIGLIDSAYEGYVFYEPTEEFFRAYAVESPIEPAPMPPSLPRLRLTPKPFVQPEQPEEDEVQSSSEGD